LPLIIFIGIVVHHGPETLLFILDARFVFLILGLLQ